MYQVRSHGIGYYWDDTNWGMIYTTIITDCIIDRPKYWPGIDKVCRWNMKRSYQINHNQCNSIITWHCIFFFCKSRWMIAKVCMNPQLGIYNHHHIPQYIDCSWLRAINRIQLHSTYMLFWCKYLKEIYILHLVLCCPKIGICAHHNF